MSRISALLGRRPVSAAVVGGLGGFGGLFDLAAVEPPLRDPLLVVGTDGVGTKLKVRPHRPGVLGSGGAVRGIEADMVL